MIDREKAIRGLEQHRDGRFHSCDKCTYVNDLGCQFKLYSDVLTLLKEQEAKTVVVDRHKVLHDDSYDETRYFEDVFYRCPSCNKILSRTHKNQRIRFCDECGQAVKWE